uniref:G_PROTEIN_RECEP_F1_2 domain-containing protein n=1 Tax=Heterorhabditis bacteriophora TaxID=37862 RepID=A0A1I7WQ53_HETBA
MDFTQCVDVNLILQMYSDWTALLEVRVVYSSLYALIFLIGVIGNGLLISSIILRKRSTVANVFLINLAVSDLLLCITAVPITPVLAFMKRWMFGLLLCKLVPSCQAISVKGARELANDCSLFNKAPFIRAGDSLNEGTVGDKIIRNMLDKIHTFQL